MFVDKPIYVLGVLDEFLLGFLKGVHRVCRGTS
jgi:hypothetical protein